MTHLEPGIQKAYTCPLTWSFKNSYVSEQKSLPVDDFHCDREQVLTVTNQIQQSASTCHFLTSALLISPRVANAQLPLHSLLTHSHEQHHGRTRIMFGLPPIPARLCPPKFARSLTLYKPETIEGIVHICAPVGN